MNYATIKSVDIANGPGVRVSLFVSGCPHHCKACFNEEAWDYQYGEPFTEETQEHLLSLLAPDYIEGMTLLGGEPMYPKNQEALLPFVKKIRTRRSGASPDMILKRKFLQRWCRNQRRRENFSHSLM